MGPAILTHWRTTVQGNVLCLVPDNVGPLLGFAPHELSHLSQVTSPL